jgi:hypothetical protein
MASVHYPELQLAIYRCPPPKRWTTPWRSHALVKSSSGLYFDSACPKGSKRLSHLGFFRGTPSWEPVRPRYINLEIVTPERYRERWGPPDERYQCFRAQGLAPFTRERKDRNE